MLPFAKNASDTKTKVLSKREEKKRINIRWNSTLFFQVGLAVTLLVCILIIESNWTLSEGKTFTVRGVDHFEDTHFYAFRTEEINADVQPIKTVKKRVVQKPLTSVFEITPDYNLNSETNISLTKLAPYLPASGTTKEPLVERTGPSGIDVVQFVPIFPGCESLTSNADRKKCMSSKINDFINKKFNSDKFSELKTEKFHTIRVQFTIGKDGKVKDIHARAKLPELEDEAKRVIGKIPLMQPGRQGHTEVDVIFMVPIMFQVQ